MSFSIRCLGLGKYRGRRKWFEEKERPSSATPRPPRLAWPTRLVQDNRTAAHLHPDGLTRRGSLGASANSDEIAPKPYNLWLNFAKAV